MANSGSIRYNIVHRSIDPCDINRLTALHARPYEYQLGPYINQLQQCAHRLMTYTMTSLPEIPVTCPDRGPTEHNDIP